MPKQLRIDGLTEDQCILLDIIYACESYDELMDFAHNLPHEERLEVLTLIQIVLHETIEVEMLRPMQSYPDAEYIIEQIRRNIE